METTSPLPSTQKFLQILSLRVDAWLAEHGFSTLPNFPKTHDGRTSMYWQRDCAVGWHRFCVQVSTSEDACRAWVWWEVRVAPVDEFINAVERELASDHTLTKRSQRASFKLAQNFWLGAHPMLPALSRGHAKLTSRQEVLHYASHLVAQAQAQLAPFWQHFESLEQVNALVNATALAQNLFLADTQGVEGMLEHAVLAHLLGSPERDNMLRDMKSSFWKTAVTTATLREREIAAHAIKKLKATPLPSPAEVASLKSTYGAPDPSVGSPLATLARAWITHEEWVVASY
jgi:hypothetical protein